MSSGISINEILMVDPNVQNVLFSIFIRFRQHNYELIGDIAKMYRQILITPEQRVLQFILWRDEATNTVTYGLSSSS